MISLQIKWKKSPLEVVSEIGGHLGLFAGVSLLTILEVCELLISLVQLFWAKQHPLT